MTAAGVILCGGRSSRMGRAKALLPWRGRAVIEHVASVLRQAVGELVVVSSGLIQLPDLDATVVEDRVPDLGPLGGIREGLHTIRSDRALFVSTDAPYLSARFARFMLAQERTAACHVGGRVQPLPAVYTRDLATTADELLEQGQRRAQDLLEAAGYLRVEEATLEDTAAFRGFNTPQEYLDAVRREGSAEPVILELRGRARRLVGRDRLEVAPGRLAEVLAPIDSELRLLSGRKSSSQYVVSINDRELVRDLGVPVGPGECVVVVDAPR